MHSLQVTQLLGVEVSLPADPIVIPSDGAQNTAYVRANVHAPIGRRGGEQMEEKQIWGQGGVKSSFGRTLLVFRQRPVAGGSFGACETM